MVRVSVSTEGVSDEDEVCGEGEGVSGEGEYSVCEW